MGVRPPSGGSDEGPESVEFGIAAVDAHLRDGDLTFPATREEIAAELGHERVSYNVDGDEVAIGEMLAELEREEFRSRQQLLNALHEPFEAYREKHSGGVVRQVRALLPF